MGDDLLDIARAIRPYLPALVGENAAACDRELVRLLEEATERAGVADHIADLLSRYPTTRDWAAQVLADELHRPPELQPVTERTLQPLPGQGEPVAAGKYRCPVDGNYVWWRRSVGIPVCRCPDHDVLLVPA